MPDQTQLLDPVLITGRPDFSDVSWQYLLDQWQAAGGTYNAPAPPPAGGGGELLPRDAPEPVLEEVLITAPRGNPTPGAPIPEVLRTLRPDELLRQMDEAAARQQQFASDNAIAQKVAEEIRNQLWEPAPALKPAPVKEPPQTYEQLKARLDVMDEALVRARKIQRAGPGASIGMGLLQQALMPDPIPVAAAINRFFGLPVNMPAPARAPAMQRKGRSESLTTLETATVTATRTAARPSLSIAPSTWGASVPQATLSPEVLDVLELANVTATRNPSKTGSRSATRVGTGAASRSGSAVRGGVGSAAAVPIGLETIPALGAPATRTSTRVPASPSLSLAPLLGLGDGTVAVPGLDSGGGIGETPPPVKEDQCSCSEKKEKKKKSKRKDRSICYRGTYVEKARGLLKTRRERVPC